MRLSKNETLPNDAPDYLKADEKFTPFEKLLPIAIAAVLSYLLVR